mgnify:CR=1 FL=1
MMDEIIFFDDTDHDYSKYIGGDVDDDVDDDVRDDVGNVDDDVDE